MRHALLSVAIAALASLPALDSAHSLDRSDRQGKPWRESESIAFTDARESGRHVVVVFGADWCAPCRKIDQIMNDDIVFGLMSERFVPLYFDITELSDRDEALQAKYHVPALPAVIFVDAAGRELGRWNQNLSARGFIAAMDSAAASDPPASEPGP
jgi:thiol:disulfide interchange protein